MSTIPFVHFYQLKQAQTEILEPLEDFRKTQIGGAKVIYFISHSFLDFVLICRF